MGFKSIMQIYRGIDRARVDVCISFHFKLKVTQNFL